MQPANVVHTFVYIMKGMIDEDTIQNIIPTLSNPAAGVRLPGLHHAMFWDLHAVMHCLTRA